MCFFFGHKNSAFSQHILKLIPRYYYAGQSFACKAYGYTWEKKDIALKNHVIPWCFILYVFYFLMEVKSKHAN